MSQKYFVRVAEPKGRIYVATDAAERREFLQARTRDGHYIYRYITRDEARRRKQHLYQINDVINLAGEITCYSRDYGDSLSE